MLPIAVILLVAWLLGFVGIYTIGSFVHVLLVVAIVLVLWLARATGRRIATIDERPPSGVCPRPM